MHSSVFNVCRLWTEVSHSYKSKETHSYETKACYFPSLNVLNRSRLYAETSAYEYVRVWGFYYVLRDCSAERSISLLHALAVCCSNSICQTSERKSVSVCEDKDEIMGKIHYSVPCVCVCDVGLTQRRAMCEKDIRGIWDLVPLVQ